MNPSRPGIERALAFRSTPSVEASRRRARYVDCSICRADNSQYLFHKVGVRFVRCRTCGLVYVNPVSSELDVRPNWFDVDRLGQFEKAEDRALYMREFEALLARLERRYRQVEGRGPTKSVLLGRFLPDLADGEVARRIGLRVVETDDARFAALQEGTDTDWIKRELGEGVELVILVELLEACSEPRAVAEKLGAALPPSAWIAATYSNAQALPARLMRRFIPTFFDMKSSFFTTNNVTALMSAVGYVLTTQFPYPVAQTAGYVVHRIAPSSTATRLLRATPASRIPVRLRTGAHVAVFRKRPQPDIAREKLSIVVPVFNEERYAAQVIEAILAKPLKIEKEVIIVESNSTDGTRAIVQKFAERPGVKVVLEDRPQGKGHAVKTGLAAVTGTIVLIQDADFEYDIDDYDALLEPILQRRTSFVLGSRSLGLDDWKVRRFDGTPVKRFMLNAAQVAFAHTFNLLYQQRITDVNTMFKVFRRECLEGVELQSDGFNLDIELACKIVKNGHSPLEVPVNYVARGFEEGKKISFVRDALPSYAAFFKYRFK